MIFHNTKNQRPLKTPEVIIPVDDSVEANDVIYRMGEEPEEVQRGPTLELGYRTKNEDGKVEENLIIDGQILNAIRRFGCFLFYFFVVLFKRLF